MVVREKKQEKIKKIASVIVCVLLLVVLLCIALLYVYASDYYKSEVSAEDFIGNTAYTVEKFSQGIFIDGKGTEEAVIFYPGAKVEYTAYLPLCVKLVEQGVDCFLVEMPFHLAIFGMNKAEKIMEEYSYENWYLAGHSLGGAMAANYVAENAEKFAGLIMLAAYPTKPLVSEELKVISIYGNKDGVLNKEKLDAGAELVPEHYTEISLGGANHAGFADYGPQEGDGEAAMDREKQQEMTVQYIMKMVQTTYE